MSDNWITVIPEDPRLVPEEHRQEQARCWFARNAPRAEMIELVVSDQIEFRDCGSNFERIACPSCGTEIPVEWWQQRMDDDYDGGFKLSRYPMPCCDASFTLHELTYEWPQGFGRFALHVMNPQIGELSAAQREELERTLGTPLRVIYQHI
ncbi:MAG: hypothetical protein JW889_07745 [Verrucomicrobia bacterium]|nr:hypothetical protein [Verrucomicrobiota bacterium]